MFYLGLYDETPVPATAKTSADIMQFLLETKLAMQPTDKDMIVMLHQFEYELKGQKNLLESSLIVKTVFVDGGRVLKRMRPAPQGRGYRVRKRSNHVTIIVDSKN